MSKSVDVEVANIKEAMTGLNNEKVITPYSLNQVIKRKAGSGGSGTPGVGLNYYWNGTELGVKREDEENYTFVDLQGPAGTNGSDGEDGAPGTPGADGSDGREIELQVTATHIQWRYVGDVSWLNLIALSLLKGADGIDGVDGTNGVDGKQVQLQKSTTHIEWKYDTDVTWTDLVSLADLKGADGSDGTNGEDGEDGQGVPIGGTTGQVLKKKSAADFDTEWGEAASVLVKATGAEVITGTDDEKYVTPKAIKDGMLVSGDTLPIGSQIPFSSLTIPDNWLLCDGSAISRVDYSELFAVIGTSYGAGDGSTTFNLPNKKGRTSVGLDTSQTEFNTVGKIGGEKKHTLTVNEMPSHSHRQKAHNWDVTPASGTSIGANEGGYTEDTTSTGGGQAHNNLQPYETDVWIIKAKQSAGVVATVVDDLSSTSGVNALSAGKGKNLNDRLALVEADSGWQYPTMSNGWVNRTENASPIRYRKIGQVVYISGAIKSGTFGQKVFTLPAGYRPAGSYMCSIVRAGSGIAMLHINFFSSGSGVVVVENLTGTNEEIVLHGISYVAE